MAISIFQRYKTIYARRTKPSHDRTWTVGQGVKSSSISKTIQCDAISSV